MHNLENLHIDENIKLCSFDITNMYTNIPINETKHTINEVLHDNEPPTVEKQELESLLNIIFEHNYMQFNDHFYKHDEGLAMGAPTSAILAETFIEHLEHSKLIKILNKHQIIDYHRYVDDILILYNKNNTLDECNTIHPNIKFTMETEIHNTLNYLDLTITNKHNKLTFSIYRKPTSTNLIIHNDSCHPYEQKISNNIFDQSHDCVPNHSRK
jgi:hypothetical protein